MADKQSSEETSLNPHKFLKIIQNPDGSLTRSNHIPSINPSQEETQITLTKDIPLNPTTKTFIRIFLPNPNHIPQSKTKLPILIDFHGGGFILFSATTKPFHDSCISMAAHIPAIILSVEYRLSPENRLPAPYEDAVDSLLWLQNQADGGEPWLTKFADFSNCYLMGSSSGGNIAYNAGLRTLDMDLSPVKIVGLILNQPFFGTMKRTESEIKLINDRVLPLPVSDLLWSLALPEGSDRDHEYCNPMVVGCMEDKIGRLPRCLIRGYFGDPLIDQIRNLVKKLESRGVHVETSFLDGFHATEFVFKDKALALYDDVLNFVSSKPISSI
ncbi:probable carboxylesterase 8 [Impatiens glandulifera]|uniref:probable carboxylesterase 8 n=1 Tax=Impatiens glandulifera TaxID=253017 RepID=UPI001FB141AF|nr:probable carboxylesterase 8 [Impatiens glandulifera]